MAAKRVWLLLPIAALLVSGCTEAVDGAKEQLDEAKAGLEKAREEVDDARAKAEELRQEAVELKARYDRVRSLEIVRTEVVSLTLTPVFDRGNFTLTFIPSAKRGDVPLPVENLTRLPAIAVRFLDAPFNAAPEEGGPASVHCEALTCVIAVEPAGTAMLAWDVAEGYHWQVRGDGTLWRFGANGWDEVDAGAFMFTDDDAAVLATTKAGDATT